LTATGYRWLLDAHAPEVHDILSVPRRPVQSRLRGPMVARRYFPCLLSAVLLCFVALALAAPPAAADLRHARIIRLSLVQGDVRFTRDAHGDPLTNDKNIWETAVLNLPIREGYVLATDRGRAEVEFENGAMAFLNENTVLEFYDLSLDNGARTTRLVLRQGAASFYVNPASGDYFSVTGGDFTAEATGRASFRLDNFDDGSTVNVTAGNLTVVRRDHTSALVKGQSLSMSATDPNAENIARLPDSDDFDRWVSGRVDSVVSATTAALQYDSNSSYTSGFDDLYTYGSWFPVSGYGYGWRPYGVGLGWCPFSSGGWFQDSAFGWGFIGNQPWGWLPYHYGGWIFQPGFGWVWVPGNLGNIGFTTWRPATATWVRSNTGTVGIVPTHPLDNRGQTPMNLAQGVFPVERGVVSSATIPSSSNAWKVEKSPVRNTLTSSLAPSSRPEPVSRTTLSGGAGNRIVSIGPNAGITYDAHEHRFVNSDSPSSRSSSATPAKSDESEPSSETGKSSAQGAATTAAAAARKPAAPTTTQSSTSRSSEPATPRRALTPPPTASERSASGNESWGGERSSGGSGSSRRGSSASSSSESSSAASSSSGRASSASSSSSSSGGRPH
jgi:hypothetical protein